ncbi:beta strand repeat-containing protein [Aeromicrobium endophyticum]|nr:immunoglobulin domain-containing protein [Aeromicrobium endophyticum]
MSAQRTPTTKLLTTTLVTCLLAGTLALVGAAPASAATSLTVTTTADVAANAGACGSTSVTAPSGPLSLREATCLANNIGGTATITVPAGRYVLASGELQIGKAVGQDVRLAGAGAGSTIIDGDGKSRVLDLDPNIVGGVAVSISGVTVTGGADSTFGGAGIIGGSGNSTAADTLSITNSVITGNVANAANQSSSNKPGGGVQFIGGSLTITSSTISGNSSYSSPGAGVAYYAQGQGSGESLTITGTTFSSNQATSSNESVSNGGGGLAVGSPASTPLSVTASRFVGNSVTGTTARADGGAIRQDGGVLTVSRSTFTGNEVKGGAGARGGAVEVLRGRATLRHNRLTGNVAATGTAVHAASGAGSVDAELNWFGCNDGPGSAGCDTVASDGTAVDVTPRLVVKASASPSTVTGPNGTSTIKASLLADSAGGAVSPSDLTAFDGLPVAWSSPKPTPATVGASSSNLSGGVASVSYGSATSSGAGSVSASLDNATTTADVVVQRPATITTNPSDASVSVGEQATFTVAAAGYPAPTVQWQRSTDGGSGYADIDGATSTTYSLTTTATDNGNRYRAVATNGVGQPATSTAATLTVGGPASFTSSDTKAFVVGSADSFTVTTSGFPAVTAITRSGALPAGLTFTDNGDGTATIAGTPDAGTAGSYPITLTAVNGRTPAGTQTLTIRVDQKPSVTTDPADKTVTPGTSVSFTAAASGAPAPTVQWQRSTNGGASFTNVAGATSPTYTFTAVRGDDGNQYRAVFTNTRDSATSTAATLYVGTAPSFTSTDHASFAVGTAGTFTVATEGTPDATVSATSTLPSWLTVTDNGDGTATLAGTAPKGSGGTLTVDLRAANGFSPAATQTFTLTVNELPSITSADGATFAAGKADSFTVTTSAGYPTARTLAKTGSLPKGVTFTDNGDGTATLAGTPDAGTGGSYPLTLTATSAAGSRQQSFTLSVTESPTITSDDQATFAAGESGSFDVTTAGGYPTSVALTASGVPSWATFTDNGDGTASLTGKPAASDSGAASVVVTADNGSAPPTKQTLTVSVTTVPTFTSEDSAKLTVGTEGSFTITATGYPAPKLTIDGDLPSGVTATENSNGSVTLSGTPAAGSADRYSVKVTAKSSSGTTEQTLVIDVVKAAQAITVTSIAPDAPVVGQSYTPAATAPGGTVAVSIGSGTTDGACSLAGGVVSFDHAGTCVIAFDQAGDGTYSAAPQLTQTIVVSTIATTVGVTTSESPTVYGQPATATATVSHVGGDAVVGSVQFSVDGDALGSPVAVSSGTAKSPELRDADGRPLAPGSHQVKATFVPTDAVRYAGGENVVTQVVGKAATTTSVTVDPASVSAKVVATSPGQGTPTGTVTFSVGGDEIGTAPLVDGVARLKQAVPTGLARQVAAVYDGDTMFTGSSTSVTRSDPTITATVASARAKTGYGWYGAPVTVSFTCTTNGAELTEPCPSPVRIGRGAGQSVTRTIASTDGGVATVVVGGINVDDQRPTLKIRGVKSGRVYGGKAPRATCAAKDALSGVASCKVTQRKRGTVTTVTATATDKAGNQRSRSVRYRTSIVTLDGATFRNGAYDVKRGRTYTLVVMAGSRPTYYEAEVAPRTPRKPGGLMRPAGHDRYALGVTMKDLRGRTYWNLGVKVGKKMHVVRVRARG